MIPIAEYFNALAQDWDKKNPLEAEKIAHIVECTGVRPCDSVLDVGTGTGVLLPELACRTGRFGSIDALDVSPSMLALAHEKHSRLPLPVRFMLCDVEHEPVHNLYDRIVLLNVVANLTNPLETLARLYVNNLNGGGAVTVAYAQAREKVNSLNRNLTLSCHELPPASAIAARIADYGIKVDYVEDNDDYYILRLRRR